MVFGFWFLVFGFWFFFLSASLAHSLTPSLFLPSTKQTVAFARTIILPGLVTRLTDSESRKDSKDFLSSIEMVIVDHADVLRAQNWAHVSAVFDALNLLPGKPRPETDVMRVHASHLEGHAKHHRQTIVLSAFAFAECNALLRPPRCANVAGAARLRRVTKPADASLPRAVAALARAAPGGLQHVIFERLPDALNLSAANDLRFEHFRDSVMPRLRESPRPGALVFVPEYFDFVRVRNALTAEDVSFAVLSEYVGAKDANRARTLFQDGRKKVLLVTERAHFYQRRRIRGAREVHFYAPPERAGFFAELAGFADRDGGAGGGGVARCVFSRLDALRVERIVGSARAKKMLAKDANPSFVFTS